MKITGMYFSLMTLKGEPERMIYIPELNQELLTLSKSLFIYDLLTYNKQELLTLNNLLYIEINI